MREADGPRVLRFDAVEIDLAGRRLLRDGVEQPLEPKAFAVLCLLVAAPGRAFSRDEILDAVWGHRHVTPGTLNRIVTLLRHALGETAEHPRYLHTVHGVGYRLDAELAPEAAEGHVTVSAPPERRVAASPSVAPPSAPEAKSSTQPLADSSQRARPVAAAEATTPQRRRAVGAALLVALAVLAWAGWTLTRPGKVPASPAAVTPANPPRPAAPVLAVLPLRPLGESTRNAEFADGLSEELINLLAQIDGLRVTSHTSSVQLRGATEPLPELARRLGATHVLEGSVRQQGERLRIALRLVDAGSDAALWTETFDRPFADIFAVQDSVARAVGEALRLRLRLRLTLPRAGPGVNEDPALYLRYLQARQRMPMFASKREEMQPATALLEALTTEHPGYARAWGGLATAYSIGSVLRGPESEELRARAETTAERALALDPEQPDALVVLAGQTCRRQQWQVCMDLSQRAIAGAPAESRLRIRHAVHLITMGYVVAALREVDLALAADPLNSPLNYYRGRILDTLGRHDDASRHFHLSGTEEIGPTAHFFNAIWRRDLATARRIAEGLDPDTPWRESNLALVDALQDPSQFPALRTAITRSEASMAARGQNPPYDFVRWFLPERDYALDIAALDQVQKAGFATYQWNFWMPREHALRQSPAFQQYLRDRGLLAFWREHGWPDVCRSDGGEGVVCD